MIFKFKQFSVVKGSMSPEEGSLSYIGIPVQWDKKDSGRP